MYLYFKQELTIPGVAVASCHISVLTSGCSIMELRTEFFSITDSEFLKHCNAALICEHITFCDWKVSYKNFRLICLTYV